MPEGFQGLGLNPLGDVAATDRRCGWRRKTSVGSPQRINEDCRDALAIDTQARSRSNTKSASQVTGDALDGKPVFNH